jgi:hypothetical protein
MSTTMKAQVESEVDDALGGGTGTALTGVPWNAAWDAEIQSEVTDALEALLIESSISAGVGLTNDTGTQLTSINLRQAVALCVSALTAVLTGAAGPTTATKPAGKPAGNTRVSLTVDATGRTASTLKVPD